jgi:hypothetical protein
MSGVVGELEARWFNCHSLIHSPPLTDSARLWVVRKAVIVLPATMNSCRVCGDPQSFTAVEVGLLIWFASWLLQRVLVTVGHCLYFATTDCLNSDAPSNGCTWPTTDVKHNLTELN